MQIAGITQHGAHGWPTLKSGPLTAGLIAICGPPGSGKSTLAGLLAHTLFGKSPSLSSAIQSDAPPGEVVIESAAGRYRVRRYRDDQGAQRLTVAGLNGAAVDANTMHGLVGGLSPAVLAPLCAVSFRESPNIDELLSADFARGYRVLERGNTAPGGRRTAELAARRDLLAQELETRIAGDRRVSKDLEARCRELDRSLRHEQEQAAAIEQAVRAIDTSLAETDTRLRYRRLEVSTEHPRQLAATDPVEPSRDDVDAHLARVRSMLSDLAQREAAVRAQLSGIESTHAGGWAPLRQTRAWLAVGRQLSADLSGEVARLARASASQQCVCRDAHPRLRPLSETVERQLRELEKLIDEQQRSLEAAELQAEVDHLGRAQAELRQHSDRLLARIQSQSAGDRRRERSLFSEADAEQLESRRLELEQQRYQLLEQHRAHTRSLRDLRAQRETVERQRAALLSARSIEHVQRELISVQQKLEQAASLGGDSDELAIAGDSPARASDYLAQLTDGGLLQLVLVEQGRRACVVNCAGETLRVESLTAAERDQVYLSLCLALLSAASRHGIRLPLVLDEPFARLDARGAAALAVVLDEFSRQGHQVVVFTGQRVAAERLSSVGAAVHDIAAFRQRWADADRVEAVVIERPTAPLPPEEAMRKRRRKRGVKRRPRREEATQSLPNNDEADSAQSDAA